MSRRTPALLLALAAALAACGKGPAAAPRNVILIVIDTLRADHLSAYGYPRSTTPHLDAFGRENVRFDQVRSSAACTFPSVNSILTSRSGFRFLGQPDGRMGMLDTMPGLAEILRRRGYSTGAVSASTIVRRSPSEHNQIGGFETGFDVFDETCGNRRAECVNGRARRFVNRTPQPFFLYLHYIDPHHRYEPPPPYRERFGTVNYGPRWARQGDAQPIFQSLHGPRKIRPSRAIVQELIDLYDGEIAYLDDRLGELFAELEARDLLRDTLIVVAADHGEEFLEHGEVWHCFNAFDSTTRVPLFLHVPGVVARAPLATTVSNLDIAPTVLDYLGIASPADFEGRSLRAAIAGETEAPRRAFSIQNEWRAVTEGSMKLVLNLRTGQAALYNLGADPGERNDRKDVDRPTFHRLRGTLETWLVAVEGSATGDRSLPITDEAHRQLEAIGYLK